MKESRDYKKEILDSLNENLFGMTVTDISTKTTISRNTVYRYLGMLEAKGKVYNKRVGTYNLYYSKKKSLLFKDGIMDFFKGLLVNLKQEFPNKEDTFKEFGRKIADSIEVPFTTKGREQLKELKDFPDTKILETVGYWLPYFNVLFDSIDISNMEIDKEKKRGVFTFVNSDMLQISDDYIYYFYLIIGLIEKKLSLYSGRNIKCNVLEYKIQEKEENSYIKVSIQIE
ncbi:MAG TPA: helix-turn-helix domain-containing protein [Candidatus Lokiarchaeia archaeon]